MMFRRIIFVLLAFSISVQAGLIPHRLIPVQGTGVLNSPPIAHGNPDAISAEADFVDPVTRSVLEDYPQLGVIKQIDAPKRLIRNNLGVFSYAQNPASVFYLLHLTDMQIVDEESPGLTPTNDFALDGETFQGAYRIHSPYIIHTANALIQQANNIAAQTRLYDLVLHTGDALESAQENELDWFLTLMNGGTILPDSADRIDLIVGQEKDPSDALTVRGVSSPWLSLIGNHDLTTQGNFPSSFIEIVNAPGFSQSFIAGMGALNITVPARPTANFRRGGFTDEQYHNIPVDLDVDDEANDQKLLGQNTPLNLASLVSRHNMHQAFQNYFNNGQPINQKIKADDKRKTVSRCDFIDAHLKQVDVELSNGFGFTDKNRPAQGRCIGHYVYYPKNNKTIKIISLDTTKEYGGAEGALSKLHKPFQKDRLLDEQGQIKWDVKTSFDLSNELMVPGKQQPLFMIPFAQGELDPSADLPGRDPVQFLKAELEKAKANGELVIVQSHHASELLYTYNEFRLRLEELICQQLGLPKTQCDQNGVLATGMPGESKMIANQRTLGLFAALMANILQQPFNSISDVTQQHINVLAQAKPQLFHQLIGAFNTIFIFRQLMPDPIEPMGTKAFRKLLASYPNVILHIAGHSHQHKILAICTNGESVQTLDGRCIDKGGEHGRGYYEIRTAANADWPIEQRIVELVDNNDGTLSIYGTIFHAPLGDDKLVETGRKLALVDAMTTPTTFHADEVQDLNVHLLVNIAHEIDEALDSVTARNRSIESLKF